MKKGLLTTVVTLVLIGTVSLSAFGYCNGRGQGRKPIGAPRFIHDLNLSWEQQQKLLEIRQDFQKETQSLRFEMQKKQLELRQLWSAPTLNQKAIETKEKEIISIRVQLVTKARAMQDKIKNVLTPDQFKKLEEGKFKGNPGVERLLRSGEARMGCPCGA